MQFLNPSVFYLLLIPIVVLMILVITNKESIHQHFSKDILGKLTVNTKAMGKTTRNILYFLTLILFITSLARPVINEKDQELKQNLIPIVVALDVSKSMRASDIYPNRLELAKKKLQSIIELSQNSTIGIVLFAKDSFVLSPVTEDFVSLKYIVDHLDTNIDFANGSNISAVLEAVNYMLKDFKVKNLIILSDGGNKKEYKDEIEFAKQNGISVYSVGIATQKGSPIPEHNGYLTDDKGNIVNITLNESIKELSLNTNGGYINFTMDSSDISAIVEKINSTSKKEKLQTQKIKTYTELFYYPLGLALFILFISLNSLPSLKKRTNKNLAMILFVSVSCNIDLNAFIFDFEAIEKADNYYKNKEYDKAQKEYAKIKQTPQSIYNQANALYKQEKYKEAIKKYSKIKSSDDELNYKRLHNIANSYAKSNDLQKAKEFYEKALNIKDDKDTIENLEIVKKELEKQKKKQDKKQQSDQNQQNSQDKKDKDQDKKGQKDEQNSQKSGKKENSKSDEKSGNKQDGTRDNTAREDGVSSKEKKKEKQENRQISGEQKTFKQQPISDMEEKKWMKMLENKKAPIFLQKVETKKGNNDEQQPW